MSGDSLRRRPIVGDRIFVSSPSIVFLGDLENKNVALDAYDFYNEQDCQNSKILFTIPRPALRKRSRGVPSVRTFLYQTSARECQEIVIYIEGKIINNEY